MLLGNSSTSIIGFVMTYVLFHCDMTTAEVGIWFVMQSFVGLCEAGRYGFLSTATVKFYAGTDKERGATVLGSIWFLAIALSALVLAINALGLFYLPYASREAQLCITWVGVNYLSSLPADVIFWRLQADEEYGKMFWFRMINSCSTVLSYIVLALIHQCTLQNVIIYNFVTNCTSSLIGLIWFRSGIQYIGKRTKECMLEIYHFGKYTLGTTLFASFLGNSDVWILNFVVGPAAVAMYNLAMKLMAVIELPLRSFGTTGLSEMAIAYNAKNMHHVGHIFKKYTGMLTLAFVPVAIITFFFAGVGIDLLGGHHVKGEDGILAANTLRLIMIVAISYPMDRFNGMALDITNNSKVNFYKMVIVIVVKIICGFLFTELLQNIYGIVIANYVSAILAVGYGYYKLRDHVPHTLGGVVVTGYKELVLLSKTILSGLKK